MEKNITNLLGQTAGTSNTLKKHIDELVHRETSTSVDGHRHERTTIEPSIKGAATGAAAGALVAGPVGAVVGGIIGGIFGKA